jgi:hypothetical protein
MSSFGGRLSATGSNQGHANDKRYRLLVQGLRPTKHRHILRPAKATLERIRRIDDAIAIAGSSEELPRSMVNGDGFRRPGTQ